MMSVYDDLKPYSHETADRDPGTAVFFIRSRSSHIEKLEKVLGSVPDELKTFWLEIGNGYIRGVPGGKVVSAFSNFFTSPATIADEFSKPRSRKKLTMYGSTAIPFFDLGDVSGVRLAYVAEGESRGSIVTFDQHRDKVSGNLESFVGGLLRDTDFYYEAFAHRHVTEADEHDD